MNGLRSVINRRWAPYATYPLLALLAYPIGEYLVAGMRARVYGHDVFEDGTVARLGALGPEWAEHGLALWNPYLTAGNAWFSQFALPPIAPDSLLSILVGPFASFVTVQALLPVAAGLAMHLFARRTLRLPLAAAVVAGTAYALSLWHYPIGLAGPLLPMLLTLADRPASRSLPVAIAAMAAVVTLALYQGLVQVTLIGGGVQLAWILWATPRRGRGRRLAAWLGGWALATAFYAPSVLTLLVALPESHRVIWDIAPEVSVTDALRQVARRYAAVLIGAPFEGGLALRAPYYGTWFAGAVLLPLMVLGAWRGFRSKGRMRFVAAMAVAIPLLDVGVLLAGPWLEEAGPAGSFQFDRVRHLVPFVVAATAGIGLSGVVGRSSARHATGRSVALAIGAVAIVVQVPHVVGEVGSIGEAGRELAPGWIRIAWLAASAAGLCALLLLATPLVRPHRRWLVLGAVVLLLVVERSGYLRVERGLAPNATTSWSERLGPSEITDRLRLETERDHSRVLMTGLHPNELLFHRIRSVTGYQNVYPLAYHRLLDRLLEPQLADDPALAAYFRRWGNRAVALGTEWSRPVVDVLGARWIVTDRPMDQPGMTPIMEDDGRRLYRNERALPRAFVADDATGERVGDAEVRFVTDEPDRVVLEVRSPSEALLVLADTSAPGWRATVAGERAAIRPAHEALRSVAVPAGASVVAFEYRPMHTLAGLAISLGAVGVLGGLLILGRRRG